MKKKVFRERNYGNVVNKTVEKEKGIKLTNITQKKKSDKNVGNSNN